MLKRAQVQPRPLALQLSAVLHHAHAEGLQCGPAHIRFFGISPVSVRESKPRLSWSQKAMVKRMSLHVRFAIDARFHLVSSAA